MPRSNFSAARRLGVKYNSSARYFKHEFRPRHEMLRKLEGTYHMTGYYGEDRELYNIAVTLFPDRLVRAKLPSGMKLSQALIKEWKKRTTINPSEVFRERVATFVENVVDQDFYITCKATDIVRMSISKHYSSCRDVRAQESYDDEPWQMIVNSNRAALIVTKDRGGEFLGRRIIRYDARSGYGVKHPGHCISVYKIYGNMSAGASLRAVQYAVREKGLKGKLIVEDRPYDDG